MTPWTVAHQAPLSEVFSRQEDWSGEPFLSPGDLSDPGKCNWAASYFYLLNLAILLKIRLLSLSSPLGLSLWDSDNSFCQEGWDRMRQRKNLNHSWLFVLIYLRVSQMCVKFINKLKPLIWSLIHFYPETLATLDSTERKDGVKREEWSRDAGIWLLIPGQAAVMWHAHGVALSL